MSTGTPPPPWSPGRKHWKVTTAIAIGAVCVGAGSTGAAVYTAMKDQKPPTVRAIIEPPAVSNVPSVPSPPTAQDTMCSQKQGDKVAGWGPDRPLFKGNDSDWPALNSIQENPQLGDERAFYGIRESGSKDLWKHSITVERGKTYTIRVYVDNNAKQLNLAARGVRLMVNLPTCTGLSIGSQALLKGENNFPREIWSGINLTAPDRFNLNFIEGSARVYGNSYGEEGRFIDETFFTSRGVLLGSDDLDGELKPGYGNALYFTYQVRPQFADKTQTS
ncbi:hypothetical protein [Streptomyces canus]|uniref:hypothetical protein n=1 Tax=Streptomyces canus TaxID=58343 RepID=UPI003243696E